MLIIFGALIYVLHRIFSRNVVFATKHLEDLSHDFNQKQEELKNKLEEAERICHEKITQAEEEANKIKLQLIKEAQDEKDKIIQQAHGQGEDIIKQADKASQMLISESTERIAREAINQAARLITTVLPAQLKQDTHERWINDLIESGFEHLDKLQLPAEITEAKVSSAFALTEVQRCAIKDKLDRKLNREVSLLEDVNSELVAGIVVTVGSMVLDGSLRYKIQEAAKKQILKQQGNQA